MAGMPCNVSLFLRSVLDKVAATCNVADVSASRTPYVTRHSGYQGYTKPGRHVARATEFCMVASNICGPSVWHLLRVSLLAPRILRCLLDFLKNL